MVDWKNVCQIKHAGRGGYKFCLVDYNFVNIQKQCNI